MADGQGQHPPAASLLRHSTALKVVAGIAGIAALSLAREVLIPLALSVFLSFLLVYPVRLLERLRMGRIPSVVVIALLAFTFLGGIGWLIFDQMSDLLAELPKHSEELSEKLESVRSRISSSRVEVKKALEKVAGAMDPHKDAVKKDEGAASAETPIATPSSTKGTSPFNLSSEEKPIFVRVVDPPLGLFKQFPVYLGPLLSPLSKVGMISLFVIFMLVKREDLRNRLIHLLSRGRLHGATQAINDATGRVARYLLTQSLINGSYGVAAGLGLYLLGVPSWALWGFLAAAFRFLPYVGPLLGAVPPIVLLAATSEGWVAPLEAAGLFIGLDLCVYVLLEPWLYGASTGVSPFAILIAAVFWTWLWGPLGLILATPLTVCLVVAGKYFPPLNFLNVLFGEDDPLTPAEQYYQRLLAGAPEEAASLLREARRKQSEVEIYDTILVPALLLADNDTLGGDLGEEAFGMILSHAREMVLSKDSGSVADKADSKRTNPDALPTLGEQSEPLPPTPLVVCVPAHDEVDAIGGELLARLLVDGGCSCEHLSTELLVSEAIDRVVDSGADAVCIVALSLAARGHARAIAKRLRARLPHISMVVWQASADPVTASVVDAVTTTAADTLAAIQRLGFYTARETIAPVPTAAKV